MDEIAGRKKQRHRQLNSQRYKRREGIIKYLIARALSSLPELVLYKRTSGDSTKAARRDRAKEVKAGKSKVRKNIGFVYIIAPRSGKQLVSQCLL